MTTTPTTTATATATATAARATATTPPPARASRLDRMIGRQKRLNRNDVIAGALTLSAVAFATLTLTLLA